MFGRLKVAANQRLRRSEMIRRERQQNTANGFALVYHLFQQRLLDYIQKAIEANKDNALLQARFETVKFECEKLTPYVMHHFLASDNSLAIFDAKRIVELDDSDFPAHLEHIQACIEQALAEPATFDVNGKYISYAPLSGTDPRDFYVGNRWAMEAILTKFVNDAEAAIERSAAGAGGPSSESDSEQLLYHRFVFKNLERYQERVSGLLVQEFLGELQKPNFLATFSTMSMPSVNASSTSAAASVTSVLDMLNDKRVPLRKSGCDYA